MKQNKSLITFCAVLALIVACLSCGGDPADAGQVGIALYDQPVIHGHNGPEDGGVLRIFNSEISGAISSSFDLTTTPQAVLTLDLGDVTAGDRFSCQVYAGGQKISTAGDVSIAIGKYSGTATVGAYHSWNVVATTMYSPLNGTLVFSPSGIFRVNGTGSLVMQMQGFTSSGTFHINGSNAQMYCYFYKRQ